MARYQHLPIYKACYGFVRESYRAKLKLPKSMKYDLGQLFFESSLKCLKLVIVANGSEKKSSHLQMLLLEMESLWTFLRLMLDLKGISSGEFKVLSERLTDITTQTQSWMKWEKKQVESKNTK